MSSRRLLSKGPPSSETGFEAYFFFVNLDPFPPYPTELSITRRVVTLPRLIPTFSGTVSTVKECETTLSSRTEKVPLLHYTSIATLIKNPDSLVLQTRRPLTQLRGVPPGTVSTVTPLNSYPTSQESLNLYLNGIRH